MTKHGNILSLSVVLFFFFITNNLLHAQEDETTTVFKNQVSTNVTLLPFGSFDISYERTIANKWAIGLGGSIYGNGFNDLSSTTSNFGTKFDNNYEITPFVRVYFQGAQNKSHFLELFGSLTGVEESGRFVRSNNSAGFGVYNRETRQLTLGGLGFGYGYRFLLVERKLVLEAQFGFRTNFDTNFIVLTGAIVRAGIKIGYRF